MLPARSLRRFDQFAPRVIFAACLCLCVAVAKADITGWTSLTIPPAMTPNDNVTFMIQSTAANFSISTYINDTWAADKHIVVLFNDAPFWTANFTGGTEPSEHYPVYLPLGSAPNVTVLLYDSNNNLINSSFTGPMHVAVGSYIGVVIFVQAEFYIEANLGYPVVWCNFSAPGAYFSCSVIRIVAVPQEPYSSPLEYGSFQYHADSSINSLGEFSCSTVSYSRFNGKLPLGTPWQLILTYTLIKTLPIPGPTVYINSTSYISNAYESASGLTNGCATQIVISVSGLFWIDRTYACVLMLDYNDASITSQFVAPQSNTLVQCEFNISSIFPKDPNYDHMYYWGLGTLVEMTPGSALANVSVLNGQQWTWGRQPCENSKKKHWVLITIIAISAVVAVLVLVALVVYGVVRCLRKQEYMQIN